MAGSCNRTRIRTLLPIWDGESGSEWTRSRFDERQPLVNGGPDERGVQACERAGSAFGQLEVCGVVHRQPVMASELERVVEVGIRIGTDGEPLQASQTRERSIAGDAPAAFGEEQGVAYFQVPDLGNERFRFRKSSEGGARPWILLVMEKPCHRGGRIEDEGAQ